MKKITVENAAYMWFDMKYELYDRLDHNDSIYLYYDGEKCSDIVIDIKYKYIYFSSDFWVEFSEVFPIKLDEFKQVMTKWIEDTVNLKGFIPPVQLRPKTSLLKIPK